MRTIIAGSRDITDYSIVEAAIKASGFTITEVVCGGARGVDTLGEMWAIDNNIKCVKMNAIWRDMNGVFHKNAGYKRNEKMGAYAQAAVICWDGQSKGTKHMIDIAKAKKLEVYIHMVGVKNEALQS